MAQLSDMVKVALQRNSALRAPQTELSSLSISPSCFQDSSCLRDSSYCHSPSADDLKPNPCFFRTGSEFMEFDFNSAALC